MTRSPIPAIVLTCQKYVPLAEHMIDRYAAVWPEHPFVFRLPDGAAAGRRSPAGFSMRSKASAAETHPVRRALSPAVIASGLAPPRRRCHARASR